MTAPLLSASLRRADCGSCSPRGAPRRTSATHEMVSLSDASKQLCEWCTELRSRLDSISVLRSSTADGRETTSQSGLAELSGVVFAMRLANRREHTTP